MKSDMRLNKKFYEILVVNLKWLEIYQLVIKSEKLILDLRNITDYEHFVNSIDEGYDAGDAIFNGYFYKINTQFKLVNRS